MKVLIRVEEPGEDEAISEVHIRAFGRTAEAEVVESLRGRGALLASLVALVRDRIVGHVALSPVEVGGMPRAAVALGPLAVDPDYQGRGIGALLVDAFLQHCRVRDEGLVVVLGYPGYYGRFGFVPAERFGLHYRDAGEAFQALEVRPGAAEGLAGEVHYHPAFDGA
ncbi:MAG: N-acetyltransferase [Actinobacteria bacterium]|nr:N-acetyltransferase [Actinomycetota bacterium]